MLEGAELEELGGEWERVQKLAAYGHLPDEEENFDQERAQKLVLENGLSLLRDARPWYESALRVFGADNGVPAATMNTTARAVVSSEKAGALGAGIVAVTVVEEAVVRPQRRRRRRRRCVRGRLVGSNRAGSTVSQDVRLSPPSGSSARRDSSQVRRE